MSPEVVALGGGILFLLVAIVGGGLVIRDLSLPKVPGWGRVTSGIFGLLLLMPFALNVFKVNGTKDAPSGGTERPPASDIEIDTRPSTTSDQITLTGLTASVRNRPPRTGDTMTVAYSLTNAGKEQVSLQYTFVGARNPAGGNKDSEDMNESRTIAPGETIQAEGTVFLDSAGTWTLWPCYHRQDDRFCPDRWKAFSVIVVG
jgi:hypothetical protein